jgi:hypothetical protein
MMVTSQTQGDQHGFCQHRIAHQPQCSAHYALVLRLIACCDPRRPKKGGDHGKPRQPRDQVAYAQNRHGIACKLQMVTRSNDWHAVHGHLVGGWVRSSIRRVAMPPPAGAGLPAVLCSTLQHRFLNRRLQHAHAIGPRSPNPAQVTTGMSLPAVLLANPRLPLAILSFRAFLNHGDAA